MKLRDRRKRVLDGIKQEDHKADLTLRKTPSSVEPITSGLCIKQEDTKNHGGLLQQAGKIPSIVNRGRHQDASTTDEFGNQDYYYRCEICNKKMTSLKSVLEHRKSVHKVRRTSKTNIKDINIEPDIYDPNFYCKSCKVTYRQKKSFRQHLKWVHYMSLKPVWKTPQNSIVPDLDNPDSHCRTYDHTYKRNYKSKNHCLYLQGAKSVEFSNQRSLLDSMTDTFCKSCDRHFASKSSYRRHLAVIHKVNWRLTQQKLKNVIPDVNDPNYYCRSCQRTMATKRSFKAHLKRLHSIHHSAPKRGNMHPDADDPNSYCRACQKTYSSRSRYRTHLRMVHQMILPSLKADVNREELPDPYHPHNHCSVCKKSWETRSKYREHCKFVHFMELSHSSIINPNATINLHHPEFYCAQCEHFYTTKAVFRTHLTRVHRS